MSETASDKMGSLFSRLHPMTRFLVVVAILHFAATVIDCGAQILHAGPLDDPMLARLWAIQAKSIAYSLTFVGGAASVEFLFRIWDELKQARTGQ